MSTKQSPGDMPLVSVVVLTYNHEQYIRQALESILMQEVDFRYEILVGDDHSTDGTVTILKEYSERYKGTIKLFLREKNIGPSRNSYELLTRARGKYLATCEGDDYWTSPNKLQQQIDFLENSPEYVGVSHRFTIVDENGVPKKRQRLNWVKQKSDFALEDFEGFYLPGQPTTFVRRNIFLDTSRDYTDIYRIHPMIADRTLMLMFLSFGRFHTLKDNMSCYRQIDSADASLTARMYKRNQSKVAMDYEINSQLESLSARLTGAETTFFSRRKQLFAFAVAMLLMKPSKQGWQLVKQMVKESQRPIRLVLSAPCQIIKRLFM